ncbi:hypothetical protein SORBI_3010G175550 [Sorghum bicolor]|uniref:Uncharacterized protein n=1 Tax=Sorghum bicolor TaxID=4558 RepID=A0A1W0VTP9_SORBI|nr:hypothetical protein SORBI_3010G175550 [Sorghum bicolor]
MLEVVAAFLVPLFSVCCVLRVLTSADFLAQPSYLILRIFGEDEEVFRLPKDPDLLAELYLG